MFKTVAEMSDVVSLLVCCENDRTILTECNVEDTDYWLPSIQSAANTSWLTNAQLELKELFSGVTQTDRLLKITKTWVPTGANTVSHAVFEVPIYPVMKDKIRTKYKKKKLYWLTDDDLLRIRLMNGLRTPEIIELYYLAFGINGPKRIDEVAYRFKPPEWHCSSNMTEITESSVIMPDTDKSVQNQLVQAAGFNRETQIALYKEFILKVFPAALMNQFTVAKILMAIGWTKDEALAVFRAMDIYNRGGLSFHDFILGLAAFDPNTLHVGVSADLRCRYIFRFYDRDQSNTITLDEFQNMMMSGSKKKSALSNSIPEIEHLFKTCSGTSPAMSMGNFLQAVSEQKLKGTSTLCRSNVQISVYLQKQKLKEKGVTTEMPSSLLPESRKTIEHIYEIGRHAIAVSGTSMTVDQFFQLEGVLLDTKDLIAPVVKPSMECFLSDSVTNEILKGIRYTYDHSEKKKEFTWGNLVPRTFGQQMITVCGKAVQCFKSESRVVRIEAPVYVLGDLHGNFGDLLKFEKILWHLGPPFCPSTILFLGDYVDRGQYSLETIAYLLAYKVQCPKKLIMLRGNHEIRAVQMNFTFYNECSTRFGDELGKQVWEAVNQTFDCLPLAAVIDNKIFCTHGGIPPPWLCPTIKSIDSIEVPLPKPDETNPLAWELMWNDPIKESAVASHSVELATHEGFAVNKRRGTGHVWCKEALLKFVMTNNFSHVIRAHECVLMGCAVQQDGRLITVFSTSNYCGATNEGGCVIVSDDRIRAFRLQRS